jgi:UDP-N-acetylmuramate dehydrogenase
MGWKGLTDVAGVPGTVGGAVLMNAQVVGAATGDLLDRVEVLTPSGRRRAFRGKELSFGYRRSLFQGTDWLILRVAFRLERGDPACIVDEVETEWNRWRSQFPLEPPNAGSVFKRPPGDYAGRLIEEAGCKGLRVGGAVVSDRHANFIHNVDNASTGDILKLIDEIRRRVYRMSGVYLELEQIVIPTHR